MKSMKQTKNAKAKASDDWASPKFKGKTFVIKGKLDYLEGKAIPGLIPAEGGTIVEELTQEVDYLITGERATGAEKQAQQLNQKKGASIQIIKSTDFLQMVTPTRDDALAMLKGGPKGVELWNRRRDIGLHNPIDLSGADLRNVSIVGLNRLYFVNIDGSDFRGSDLSGAHIDEVSNANFAKARLIKSAFEGVNQCCFDGAVMQEAYVQSWKKCTALKADLTGFDTAGVGMEAENCDFSKARLTGVRAGSESKFRGTIFREADLSGSSFPESDCQKVDFSKADLRNVQLQGSNCKGAKFKGAKLAGANLAQCNLVDADLTGADLTDANFTGANLSKATIDGADFTGAHLGGAKLDGLNSKKAKGLMPQVAGAGGKVGPHIKKLDALLGKSMRDLTFSIIIDLPDGPSKLRGWHNGMERWHGPDAEGGWPNFAKTFREQIFDFTRPWAHGKPRLDSVNFVMKSPPVPCEEMHALLVASWCEAFGVPIPAAEEIAALAKSGGKKMAALRETILQELRGPDATARYMVRPRYERYDSPENRLAFNKANLSGAKLDGIEFLCREFDKANFDGASLSKSRLVNCQFKETTFHKANLSEAKVEDGRLQGAVFQGANLGGCTLSGCFCRKADFRRASLRGVSFYKSDLSGADLSTADLTGASLKQTKFDENTRFPAGFTPPKEMKWGGKGADPRKQSKLAPANGPIDFDGFMKRLAANTYPDRLKNALKMLKADHFKLFADVDAASLVGVVKSQRDAELVYSCKLTADGNYACCTQNLNVCGGLRDALCKHLLVLVVGLTKAGQLDPAIVDRWVAVSMGRKPVLDKDAMSETFLRYKGAEAGEVDWRPIETIPEDYYAL